MKSLGVPVISVMAEKEEDFGNKAIFAERRQLIIFFLISVEFSFLSLLLAIYHAGHPLFSSSQRLPISSGQQFWLLLIILLAHAFDLWFLAWRKSDWRWVLPSTLLIFAGGGIVLIGPRQSTLRTLSPEFFLGILLLNSLLFKLFLAQALDKVQKFARLREGEEQVRTNFHFTQHQYFPGIFQLHSYFFMALEANLLLLGSVMIGLMFDGFYYALFQGHESFLPEVLLLLYLWTGLLALGKMAEIRQKKGE
jgi:hypothetical protein